MCVHECEAGRGKVEIKGAVPVRRFPSPSRSIHFGNMSEVNARERLDQVTRNALAVRNNEA